MNGVKGGQAHYGIPYPVWYPYEEVLSIITLHHGREGFPPGLNGQLYFLLYQNKIDNRCGRLKGVDSTLSFPFSH
jgi:hypothetical protein